MQVSVVLSKCSLPHSGNTVTVSYRVPDGFLMYSTAGNTVTVCYRVPGEFLRRVLREIQLLFLIGYQVSFLRRVRTCMYKDMFDVSLY